MPSFSQLNINRVMPERIALYLRLAVGSAFGLAIASIVGTDSLLFANDTKQNWRVASSITLFLGAMIIWAGAGAMRRISLALWSSVAFTFIAGVSWYTVAILKSGEETMFLIAPLLFIAHELVSSADQADAWVAPYETYFDQAWKRGVQLVLAILFTLLFWGILWLGAALLGFIGFNWFKELLLNRYFSWPMTGLAFGAAVHLGDVQATLLSNVRNLILGVLSWLLPVITLIGAIFAGSLVFSGLAPLWATKAATATLLSACVGFVLLINAAYQQGDVERPVPVVLKWCVRVAALLLLVFAALAVWSLSLRIGQYGLSRERVFAGLAAVIAMAYGIFYGAAVFVPGRWMRALDGINIGLAVFKSVLFIAVLTPLSTPDHLSVNDQVSRLTSGKVSVEKFDWWLLKDDTGQFGKDALKVLAASTNASIAAKAKAAIANQIGRRPSFEEPSLAVPPVTRADLEAIDVVFPKNAKLPESFMITDFTIEDLGFTPPSCLTVGPINGEKMRCKAALLDLNSDGAAEILIRDGQILSVLTFTKGRWVGSLGHIEIGTDAKNFDDGKLAVAAPLVNDVLIGGVRKQVPRFFEPEVDVVDPANEPRAPTFR